MKDLTGQRFGRLTAIRPTEQRKSGSVVWECACDCGNTIFTPSAYLCFGDKLSCGCLQRERLAEDLTGKRFGRLTVIGRSEKRMHQAVLWECKCDCGNTTFLIAYRLESGMTKSCGCLKKEYLYNHGKGRAIDLTGQRFGRLTALRPTEERRHGVVVWECVCDCGNTAFVSSDALKSRKNQSCGCLRREHMQRLRNAALKTESLK